MGWCLDLLGPAWRHCFHGWAPASLLKNVAADSSMWTDRRCVSGHPVAGFSSWPSHRLCHWRVLRSTTTVSKYCRGFPVPITHVKVGSCTLWHAPPSTLPLTACFDFLNVRIRNKMNISLNYQQGNFQQSCFGDFFPHPRWRGQGTQAVRGAALACAPLLSINPVSSPHCPLRGHSRTAQTRISWLGHWFDI